jgi:hypothetical protein
MPGHHADRPADGPPAWRPDHDYAHRDGGQLPAWYFELQGQPVPDDAPRTPPPRGFADLMARRRAASLAAGMVGGEGWDPLGRAELDGDDVPGPQRKAAAGQQDPQASRPEPGPAAPRKPRGSPAAEPAPEWCGTCGYQVRPVPARGHKITCLGQT